MLASKRQDFMPSSKSLLVNVSSKMLTKTKILSRTRRQDAETLEGRFSVLLPDVCDTVAKECLAYSKVEDWKRLGQNGLGIPDLQTRSQKFQIKGHTFFQSYQLVEIVMNSAHFHIAFGEGDRVAEAHAGLIKQLVCNSYACNAKVCCPSVQVSKGNGLFLRYDKMKAQATKYWLTSGDNAMLSGGATSAIKELRSMMSVRSEMSSRR